jgi:hypothetical protein
MARIQTLCITKPVLRPCWRCGAEPAYGVKSVDERMFYLRFCRQCLNSLAEVIGGEGNSEEPVETKEDTWEKV